MPRYKDTGIILTGGVDDIWQDIITRQLIIVNYKSQPKDGRVENKDYLEDPFHETYKIKMDFYAYLLSVMVFSVHPTSYFLVCNAKKGEDEFNKTMSFEEYLVLYKWSNDWKESRPDKMVELMNQSEIPESNPSCKNCAYEDKFENIIFRKFKSKRNYSRNYAIILKPLIIQKK